MKYLTYAPLLIPLGDAEYEVVKTVSTINMKDGRGQLRVDNDWQNYCIIDTDDYFRTFCAIAHGIELCPITDDEYRQLDLDGACFFSKERTKKIYALIIKMLELKKR